MYEMGEYKIIIKISSYKLTKEQAKFIEKEFFREDMNI